MGLPAMIEKRVRASGKRGEASMKLLILPPYKNFVTEGQPMPQELLENMRRKGALDGVEIDIDEAHPTDWTEERRDEEFLASISPGVIKKVREYSEKGGYDAIVSQGSMEPGFFAARQVSKIPFSSALHSALHVASLIGERFCVIDATDTQALITRRFAESYGFGKKLVSVRYPSYSSTQMAGFFRKYKKEERAKVPEVKKCIDDIVAQCKAAVEQDRADSIILACPPLQIFEDEIRGALDEAGYSEIPLICELAAAVEMAKVMVNMKLTQARRAYPSDDLRAKPAFR